MHRGDEVPEIDHDQIHRNAAPISSDAGLPVISVVTPFRASERSIIDCLRSVTGMDYPQEQLEIIVVDDGRDDSISKSINHLFPQAKLLRNKTPLGCDGCKQLGIHTAAGDYIAMTDADCTVSPLWARVIARNLTDGIDAITGPVRHPHTILRELVGIADFQDFQSNTYRAINAFPGCNFASSREVLERVVYLRNDDMRFGSDRLTSWHMHASGLRIAYDPSMIVHHWPQVTIGSLMERRLRYGKKALALREIDKTLPGAQIVGLGPLAAPAYVCYKSAKDALRLAVMAKHHAVNPWHVPVLIPTLLLFRLLDAAGILRYQIHR